jgi:two-component system, cell cycle response regulator
VGTGFAAVAIEPEPAPAQHEQGGPRPGTQAAHILIVQADVSARGLVADLFAGQGYRVSIATDGGQAIEQLRSEPFDLVLSDLALARGNGLELVVQLRHQGLHDLPVILMSGQHDRALGISGLDLGADDFLIKPIRTEELLARVRAQLRRGARQCQLARDSVVDPLTRVLNRRGLAELFTKHAALQNRRGGALSVLVLDLDGFKLVNDRHGHAAGDIVLGHVGRALAEAVRASDTVARLGGDEFAILMPQADLDVAWNLARRTRALSPAYVPITPAVTLQIGFSLGLATRYTGESLAQLLARADASMYRAKRARISA